MHSNVICTRIIDEDPNTVEHEPVWRAVLTDEGIRYIDIPYLYPTDIPSDVSQKSPHSKEKKLLVMSANAISYVNSIGGVFLT